MEFLENFVYFTIFNIHVLLTKSKVNLFLRQLIDRLIINEEKREMSSFHMSLFQFRYIDITPELNLWINYKFPWNLLIFIHLVLIDFYIY